MIKVKSTIGDAASAVRAERDEDRARLAKRTARPPEPEGAPPLKSKAEPPSHRVGKEAMTVFYPIGLRTEIKIAAARENTDITDVVAEALNLWFASRGMPEIMPRRAKK